MLFIAVAALVDDVVTVFGLLLLVTLYNHVPIGVTTGEHSNQDRIYMLSKNTETCRF